MSEQLRCKCGHMNSLEGLLGMPLRNTVGQIVDRKPVDLETGVLIIECESCKEHIVWDCAKHENITP